MKILLVNYYYKPMVDAHAYRWTQLSEYWVSKGFEVDVICSKVRGLDNVETCRGVNIARVGFRAANMIQSESLSSKSDQGFLLNFLAVIKKLFKSIYRGLYWPDGLWHWFFAATFELFKRRVKKYDLIVSYAPSFSAHLAVFFYKKISREKFQWVADYGDPFSTSISMPHNNAVIYSGLDEFVEGLILKTADKVFFTNKKTFQDYFEKFNEDNFHINPHLVDVERFYCGDISYFAGDVDVIRFLYIGNFHSGIREPFLAVKIFNLLAGVFSKKGEVAIIFDVYGASNGLELHTLCNSTINWHGPIARSDVHEIINRADFLVNIENSNCSMTPSKVVECVATGKPIINIANSESDLSGLLVEYEALGWAINLVGYSDKVIEELFQFVGEHRMGGVCSFEDLNKFLCDSRIESVASRYLRQSGVSI